MHPLLLFLSLIGTCLSMGVVQQSEVMEAEAWQMWKTTHEKSYKDEGEEKVRFTIWRDNFQRIIEHNQKRSNLTLSMNKFGDMTTAEFSAQMNGNFPVKMRENSKGSSFLLPSNVNVPDTVDWRTKGLVTPIKDQKQCGSCWAFSAIGSLEGQHAKKSGKLVSLSEQQLVDCSGKFGNLGCNGGLMDNAFQYIKANGGEDTEASYPYKGVDGECAFNKTNVAATVTGFVDVQSKNESALQVAVATIGPIAVAIDASHFSFQFYHKGVYDEWFCSQTRLDHGVLAVGYGADTQGTKYWLVKNSWGVGWGQKGYIWMSRDRNNQCGIATQASYPLV